MAVCRRAFLTAGLVYAADRLTKLAVVNVQPGEVIAELPPLARIVSERNTGASFGMFGNAPWVPAAFSAVVLAAVLFLILREKDPFRCILYSALAAGIAGNLTDRLLYGAVIDMIDPVFVRFAVMNVADIAITVSIALLIIAVLLEKPSEKKEAI